MNTEGASRQYNPGSSAVRPHREDPSSLRSLGMTVDGYISPELV